MARILKRLRALVQTIGDRLLPDRLYFKVFRLLYPVANRNRRGSRTRFEVVGPRLYQASDPDGTSLLFCERTRMRLYHYPKGVNGRLSSIEKKYSTEGVSVADGDLVIDIGANIGEFSRAIVTRASRLFAIDPDPNVQEALSRNLRIFSNAIILPHALSDTDSEVELYLNTRQADSSLVRPKQFSETVTVRAMRLDSLIAEQGIERIDFLKLEAEGWEPEILAGATRALALTQKVAVDAGPERHGQPTAKDVLATLSAAGFEVSYRGDMVFAWRSKP